MWKEKNVDNKLNEIPCHIKFWIDKQLSTYYITAPTVQKLLSTCLLAIEYYCLRSRPGSPNVTCPLVS